MRFFVDVIVETAPGEVLLVERGVAPLGWAFPGGEINHDESPDQAAAREVEEETGLKVRIEEIFHVYPFFGQNGLMTGATYVYRATVIGGAFKPGSDARTVNSFPFSFIPVLISAHEEILKDYLHHRQYGERPEPGAWLLGADVVGGEPMKKAA